LKYSQIYFQIFTFWRCCSYICCPNYSSRFNCNDEFKMWRITRMGGAGYA